MRRNLTDLDLHCFVQRFNLAHGRLLLINATHRQRFFSTRLLKPFDLRLVYCVVARFPSLDLFVVAGVGRREVVRACLAFATGRFLFLDRESGVDG